VWQRLKARSRTACSISASGRGRALYLLSLGSPRRLQSRAVFFGIVAPVMLAAGGPLISLQPTAARGHGGAHVGVSRNDERWRLALAVQRTHFTSPCTGRGRVQSPMSSEGSARYALTCRRRRGGGAALFLMRVGGSLSHGWDHRPPNHHGMVDYCAWHYQTFVRTVVTALSASRQWDRVRALLPRSRSAGGRRRTVAIRGRITSWRFGAAVPAHQPTSHHRCGNYAERGRPHHRGVLIGVHLPRRPVVVIWRDFRVHVSGAGKRS
jgi:hypothetical protein